MATPAERQYWVGPTFSVGFAVAGLILLLTILMAFMKIIDLQTAMIIGAICAIRL